MEELTAVFLIGHRASLQRLYETHGGQARATLKITGLPVAAAVLTNLLEEAVSEPLSLETTRNVDGVEETLVQLAFHGFEIKTVKLVLGDVRSVWVFLLHML